MKLFYLANNAKQSFGQNIIEKGISLGLTIKVISPRSVRVSWAKICKRNLSI